MRSPGGATGADPALPAFPAWHSRGCFDPFAQASAAYKQLFEADGGSHPRSRSIFFVELELGTARDAFNQLNVQSLPFVFVLRGAVGAPARPMPLPSPSDPISRDGEPLALGEW